MQGLQVWDENGNILVDASKRLSVILFKFALTGTAQTFNMSSDLFLTNTAFYIAPLVHPYVYEKEPVITLTQSGQSCTIVTRNIKTETTAPEILVGVF